MDTNLAESRRPENPTREGGLRVVAIGGGTGLSTLLKGLKRFVLWPSEIPAEPEFPSIRDLSAVVTVSDDGTVKTKDKTVTQSSDGTVTKTEETQKTTPPANP